MIIALSFWKKNHELKCTFIFLCGQNQHALKLIIFYFCFSLWKYVGAVADFQGRAVCYKQDPILGRVFLKLQFHLMFFSIYACSDSFAGSVGYLPFVCIPCGCLFACSWVKMQLSCLSKYCSDLTYPLLFTCYDVWLIKIRKISQPPDLAFCSLSQCERLRIFRKTSVRRPLFKARSPGDSKMQVCFFCFIDCHMLTWRVSSQAKFSIFSWL
jgi:hypothetical protein